MKAPTQAVVLAAGKSTRTYPLSVNRPKALLSVANVPIIEHTLSALSELVNEIIVVTGFEGQQLKEHVERYARANRIKVRFVQQQNLLGTGHALLQAQSVLSGRFLVVAGDDLYSPKDLAALAAVDLGVLGMPFEDYKRMGMLVMKAGFLSSIVEKPSTKVSDIAGTGAYVLDGRIFDSLKKVKKSASGEYYLTDAVSLLCAQAKVSVARVKDYWLPIGYPWDLLAANEFLLNRMKPVISKTAIIEKGATLKGAVSVGAKTLVRAGVYIDGPVSIGADCIIGPNCHIRPGTSIGDGVHIGNGCEIKNSLLFEKCRISHLNYVGDSVIGRGANLAGGTITANLRHDGQAVSSMVNGALVSSGRTKLGAIVGDFAKTGINTNIFPGRKIWPYKTTMPGENVKVDVM